MNQVIKMNELLKDMLLSAARNDYLMYCELYNFVIHPKGFIDFLMNNIHLNSNVHWKIYSYDALINQINRDINKLQVFKEEVKDHYEAEKFKSEEEKNIYISKTVGNGYYRKKCEKVSTTAGYIHENTGNKKPDE